MVPAGVRHAWQAYVTYVDPDLAPLPRNEMMKILHEKGCATRPGTHAVHMLAAYKQAFGYTDNDFRLREIVSATPWRLPLHNRMRADDYAYVVQCLRSFKLVCVALAVCVS